MSDRHASRRSKLISLVRKTGLSALLVTNPRNVTYLTGFTGEDSYLLIGPDLLRIFSDSRFETQLQDECPGIQAEIRTSRRLMPDFLSDLLPSFH
jgi:Xaa-Pro aminopeptidase